ncbi:MAG: DUF2791 family P-loop domain-containing protein [Eubacteriales bacterium]|nr:DUF2791 family P-loop domain-containing protein [Eubacteriales bacterium]
MVFENTAGQGQADRERLLKGQAPEKQELLRGLSVGIEFLSDFWKTKYFEEYIRGGGSKMKFVTGRPGSGKTHFLRLAAGLAADMGYKTVCFSARDIWLHDFKEIYVEILSQCDILECLEGCARQIVARVGYQPDEIPEGMTFMDYLSQQSMADAITKREIRLQLKEMFLDNPLLDNNFALACSLLTGGILGHPVLENQNRELLDNDNQGIKSYQALWMRIQNEVVGARFNCFADIVDLDRLGEQIYTVPKLVEMSERFAQALGRGEEITAEGAEHILSHSRMGGVGLPRLVLEAVLSGTETACEPKRNSQENDTEGGERNV